ncbi:FUSC family protein [Paenibacillus sp. A14]|uniref:FUSC family protein n=1 Tax=Paenibacillus sp. A14 TaxID=3119820 RepID=UPI002FE266D2
MKWGIGLRNMKTGLAICICVLISAMLKLEYPFYAAIATIISMENSVTNSFTAGKYRTMGTIVGAIVGAGFAFVEPGNAVYCALGVMIVIYICNLLKWNKSVSIGCIVFLAIMLNLQPGESPLFYGINRITDTLIGIVVAVVVNYAVFPPKHEISLHKKRKALARRMADVFEQIAERGEEADLKSLRSELGNLEKYYRLCKDEFHLKKDVSETMEQIGEEVESYRHIYEHLIILRRLMDEHRLELAASTEVAACNADCARAGQIQTAAKAEAERTDVEIRSSIAIVYDYHVNWIYNKLQKLGMPVPLKEMIRRANGADLRPVKEVVQ